MIHLLGQMSRGEALLLESVCRDMKILPGRAIATAATTISLDVSDAKKIMRLETVADIGAAVESLIRLNLIGPYEFGSGENENEKLRVYPRPLALYLYARIKGHAGDPRDCYREDKADIVDKFGGGYA